MLAGSTESWVLEYTVEFWNFLFTCTHSVPDQGDLPAALRAALKDSSYHGYLPRAIHPSDI